MRQRKLHCNYNTEETLSSPSHMCTFTLEISWKLIRNVFNLNADQSQSHGKIDAAMERAYNSQQGSCLYINPHFFG